MVPLRLFRALGEIGAGASANEDFVVSFLNIRKRFAGDPMPLRMRVHEREPIGLALRRFKKLLERSGIQKELRKRKYYEKPCEARRRAELRKQSAIRKAKTMGTRTKV
jgi:small subunit ribosomal protein S21